MAICKKCRRSFKKLNKVTDDTHGNVGLCPSCEDEWCCGEELEPYVEPSIY